MTNPDLDTQLDEVFLYHEQTKHRLEGMARGPGHLDWATQPKPFRRYHEAPVLSLQRPPQDQGPQTAAIYHATSNTQQKLDRITLSRFLYDCLALSAWKQLGQSSWSLRCNPSSGNLHPEEAYLLTRPVKGLSERPGLFHYAPEEHGLEHLADLPEEQAQALFGSLAPGTFLLALSSIHWREAWKYGERAFRYCQLDLGHAMAAISISAGLSGWHTEILEGVSDEHLARLIGIDTQMGPEAEQPDCLLAISPTPLKRKQLSWTCTQTALSEEPAHDYSASTLSPAHRQWTAISEVARAARKPQTSPRQHRAQAAEEIGPDHHTPPARQIIRTRRSAIEMDGQTEISADDFFRMLKNLDPAQGHLWRSLPWQAVVHPVFYVHRAADLAPGLYLQCRNRDYLPRLKESLSPEFSWETPLGCPQDLSLFMLAQGDLTNLAQGVSCRQSMAGQGCFAVSMLAEFDRPIQEHGPWFYRRLYWEAGAIGQVLYLEAERLKLRGCGIGCFFDDQIHQVMGLTDRSLQCLYNFTVGGPVPDTRLKDLPAYHHLDQG